MQLVDKEAVVVGYETGLLKAQHQEPSEEELPELLVVNDYFPVLAEQIERQIVPLP